MESRHSEGVPFAGVESLWPGIWQIYRPWRVPKSGHMTSTSIENLHIEKIVEKFTDSKMLFFSIQDEKWRSYRGKTVSEQWRHQAIVAFSARHSSRTKHRSRILSYSFDLQSCLHKYKRLVCRVCGKALEKCCQIRQKLNYITPLKTVKMPPITLVDAWPSWIDAHRQYILLVSTVSTVYFTQPIISVY